MNREIDLLTPDRERELGKIIRQKKGGKQRQAAREDSFRPIAVGS